LLLSAGSAAAHLAAGRAGSWYTAPAAVNRYFLPAERSEADAADP